MKKYIINIFAFLFLCCLLCACTKQIQNDSSASSAVNGSSLSSEIFEDDNKRENENFDNTAAHITKTLSSGVMVDTGVYVPESMQQQNLPEMQGTGQEIDFEKIKEIFCAGKKITEETEGSYPPDMPGALTEAEKHLSTEDGDYLLVGCGNSFFTRQHVIHRIHQI